MTAFDLMDIYYSIYGSYDFFNQAFTVGYSLFSTIINVFGNINKVGQIAFQIVLIYNPTSMYENAQLCKFPQIKRSRFFKEVSE